MRKLFLLHIVPVLMLLAAPVCSAQEAAPALAFDQFARKVMAHYPALKAAHADVQAALAREVQARAGFWPSLGLSAGYQESDDPVNVFGMKLRQERFTSSDFEAGRLNTPRHHRDLSGGVHVELPLFDAMQTIYRSRSARAAVKASEAEESFTRMEALLMAQDAFLNALALDRLSAIVDEVHRSAGDDLEKAKDLKDKGMILGADYYAARVMFGDMTRMKNELARQKKAMTVLLNVLMGEPAGTAWQLTGALRERTVPAQGFDELVQQAMAGRPDLQALGQRLKAAEAELSRQKAGVLPRVSAFADGTNNRRDIDAAGGNNFTVGVKADLAVFDRSRSGRVREARAAQERLAHDLQAMKDEVTRALGQEAARHGALLDNAPVFKEMTADAHEAVALTEPLYREGRKSVADLMDVRRGYLQAAEAHEKALMGIWMSEGRLLFLTGQLDEGAMKALAEEGGL